MLKQFLKFAVVGVIAAIIDVGTLVLLKELFFVDVLIANAIGFVVSVFVNYILSMTFVFKGKKQSKVKEFVIFVLLSTGGLILNELIVWVGTEFLNIYYLIVKFGAMGIVLCYNFITRKIFLEEKK